MAKEIFANGIQIVPLSSYVDERGTFLEIFNETIPFLVKQDNLTYPKKAGTLRGLHTQIGPYAQSRIVYCIKGAFYSLSVDLRKGSPYYGKSHILLMEEEKPALQYIPKGFAHGILSLKDDTIYTIKVDESYNRDRTNHITLSAFYDANELDFDKLVPGLPLIQSQRDQKEAYQNPQEIDSGVIYTEEN